MVYNSMELNAYNNLKNFDRFVECRLQDEVSYER